MGRGNPGLQFAMCTSPNDGNSGDGDCGHGGTVSPYDPYANDPDAEGQSYHQMPIGNWTGGDPSPNSPDQTAMTVSFVKSMLVSLTLLDTPVRYVPPVGPTMHFSVHYSQREIAQPSTVTYANLGPNWTFSYLAYVKPGAVSASVYEPGGGVDSY